MDVICIIVIGTYTGVDTRRLRYAPVVLASTPSTCIKNLIGLWVFIIMAIREQGRGFPSWSNTPSFVEAPPPVCRVQKKHGIRDKVLRNATYVVLVSHRPRI